MTERLSTPTPRGNTGAAPGDRPPPARFAYDRHTWLEIAHLLANLPASLLGFVYVVTMLFTGVGLTVTVIGFPLLAAGLMGARQLGKLERARARALLGVRVDEPSRLPLRGGGGFFPQLWMALKDPVGWRTVLYDFIRLPWGILTFVTTLTSLFVLWPVLPFIARGLANADRAMVRARRSPTHEPVPRVAARAAGPGRRGAPPPAPPPPPPRAPTAALAGRGVAVAQLEKNLAAWTWN
ncbi:sensor domain-containing protein [Streptomyces sp. NPDC058964]|uniref:sensor domain-containing protein n=1 Tax=Streptomyces sp. NPDC058964 TaxID=3346681 RepID=UPI0036BDB8CE